MCTYITIATCVAIHNTCEYCNFLIKEIINLNQKHPGCKKVAAKNYVKNGHVEKDMKSKNGRPMAVQ